MKSSREILEDYVCNKINNSLVCKAFGKVDRKLFVPSAFADYAYSDSAIPLNNDSSISQPSLVAQMIDLLQLTGREHVLEIGTASGYSAAILSLCCRQVHTIEINSKLAKSAQKRLKDLGFNNITVHTGDGSLGLASKAPFDGIIVTAAVREIPKALIVQLKNGGKIVIPVETNNPQSQDLVLGLKNKDRLVTKAVTIVKFVPLV